MNQIKFKIYREVCGNFYAYFDGAEKFISNKIEEICSREKISFKEVIYFVYEALYC